MFKSILHFILQKLYRVKIEGLENLKEAARIQRLFFLHGLPIKEGRDLWRQYHHMILNLHVRHSKYDIPGAGAELQRRDCFAHQFKLTGLPIYYSIAILCHLYRKDFKWLIIKIINHLTGTNVKTSPFTIEVTL
jgi:hypothetical protein